MTAPASFPSDMDEWTGCDGPRCPARAYVTAYIGRHTLTYCGHHYAVYASQLDEAADWIVDERSHITA